MATLPKATTDRDIELVSSIRQIVYRALENDRADEIDEMIIDHLSDLVETLTGEFSESLDTFCLPEYLACALFNGDESGMEEDDRRALDLFVSEMIEDRGSCDPVAISSGSSEFMAWHDARSYGVLPCDCRVFTFRRAQETETTGEATR